MGDFYELFFDDAEIAARALDIALTKRGKHLGDDIPMCGVPVQRADAYLQKLIAAGLRVAVCEQIEDPAEAKKRGAKSVVKRDVVRLVTPGTLTEDALLEARRNNYLDGGRARRGRRAKPSSPTASPGSTSRPASFASPRPMARGSRADIARIEPGEIVVAEALHDDPALARLLALACRAVTPLDRGVFDSATAERRLSSFFGVATIESFGALSRLELAAAAAAIAYIERTQIGRKPPRAAGARGGELGAC